MTAVVRLGAWCDLATDGDTAGDAGDAGDTVSFRVTEVAVLADGRTVTLHADRGLSVRVNRAGGAAPVDPWAHLTREGLEADVRTAVLPDDAEDSGEEHPWPWLSALLGAQGVVAPPEELRALPYDVVLSERVLARLPGGGLSRR